MSETRDARSAILGAIARGLAGATRDVTPPKIAPWFDMDESMDRAALIEGFRTSLRAVDGETRSVASRTLLPESIREFALQRNLGRFIAQDRALARHSVSLLPGTTIADVANVRADPALLESLDCGILQAELLLADTGSAIVLLRNGTERLMAYLPPDSAIVAPASALLPHMTAAALEVIRAAAQNWACGEAVIITGPSRTADIEKQIVLGAHGPRTLTVFIVEDE